MQTKENIRLIIKQSGVKKSFIADKLGMSRQGLDYHVAGKGNIDQEIYEKILAVLSSDRFHGKSNYVDFKEGQDISGDAVIDAPSNSGYQNIAFGNDIKLSNKAVSEETLIELKDLREINRALFKENIDLKNKLELCLRKNENGKADKPSDGES